MPTFNRRERRARRQERKPGKTRKARKTRKTRKRLSARQPALRATKRKATRKHKPLRHTVFAFASRFTFRCGRLCRPLSRAHLCVLSGLCVQTVVRVKDPDFGSPSDHLAAGEGQKDRVTMLPSAAREALSGTWQTCAGSMRRTWRAASGESCCRLRSIASFPMRQPSGGGSSCFHRHGFAVIRDSGR